MLFAGRPAHHFDGPRWVPSHCRRDENGRLWFGPKVDFHPRLPSTPLKARQRAPARELVEPPPARRADGPTDAED